MFSKIKGENEQQRIKSERELSFEKGSEKKNSVALLTTLHFLRNLQVGTSSLYCEM